MTAATALLMIAALYVVVLVFALALARAAADPDRLSEHIDKEPDQRPGADRFWAPKLDAGDRAPLKRAFERDPAPATPSATSAFAASKSRSTPPPPAASSYSTSSPRSPSSNAN